MTFKPSPIALIDPENVPARPWVLQELALRGYLTVIIAPGGAGKSLLTINIGLSIALGHDFAGLKTIEPGPVLFINTEDDADEMRRRVLAHCQVHGLSLETVAERIHFSDGSFLAAGMCDESGEIFTEGDIDACARYVHRHGIKTVFVDPLAETHNCVENSNDQIKQVAMIYRDELARRANCAVVLIHHSRKSNGNGTASMVGDQDAGRGGGALVNVARVAKTLFPMGKEDANRLSIDAKERYRFVRLDSAKANLNLGTLSARWFYKHSQSIGNGDKVGVLVHRPDLEELEASCDQAKSDAATDQKRRRLSDLHDFKADVAMLLSDGDMKRSELINELVTKRSMSPSSVARWLEDMLANPKIQISDQNYQIVREKMSHARTAPWNFSLQKVESTP